MQTNQRNEVHEDDSISKLKQLLQADGLIDDSAVLTPLSGGVSSAIFRVESKGRRFVVKRALQKLKVAQDWFADVGRYRNEAAYLRYVGEFLPCNVPRLLFTHQEHGYFCMEYLGDGWSSWKQRLLHGDCDLDVATAAGRLLGAIHERSVRDAEVAQQFNTLDNFEQLRIEPYLLATARSHPKLRNVFSAEADRLRLQKDVLVHGDFSPKNILVNSGRLVIVDCEVAWFGDAAFDIAFVLNHLLLKSLIHPSKSRAWRGMFNAVWSAYVQARFVREEVAAKSELEMNTGWLLLMLLLARIDGKSPVEYLSESRRDFVREFTVRRLFSCRIGLSRVADEWFCEICDRSHERPWSGVE